jgi:broad specificity phosphatase PhoE
VSVTVIRHGETAWSLSGQHTGTTDIPLTESGRHAATRLRSALVGRTFAAVLTSPAQRARETCELAGLGHQAMVDPDLVEWNYGDYEGKTSDEIHKSAPGWQIFRDGAPGGESPTQIGARVDRVIRRMREIQGNGVLFSHGHFSRVLAARWMSLPPRAGENFLLDTGTLCVLDYYRDTPAIKIWNAPVVD